MSVSWIELFAIVPPGLLEVLVGSPTGLPIDRRRWLSLVGGLAFLYFPN